MANTEKYGVAQTARGNQLALLIFSMFNDRQRPSPAATLSALRHHKSSPTVRQDEGVRRLSRQDLHGLVPVTRPNLKRRDAVSFHGMLQ